VHLKNGEKHSIEKRDYEGFHTRPMSWETITRKFEGLAEPYTSTELREQIVEVTQNFEKHSVGVLMKLLEEVKPV
jgi:2-methylcitrate dehydratase